MGRKEKVYELVPEEEQGKFEVTKEEQDMLETHRKVNIDFRKDEDAYKIGVMCDADYMKFTQLLSNVEQILFSMHIVKDMLNLNKKDLVIGETQQKFKDGVTKSLTNLKTDNIKLENTLHDNLQTLRQTLFQVYLHVGIVRTGDKKIYFTEKDWIKLIKQTKDKLKDIGMDLYAER